MASPITCMKGKILDALIFPNRRAGTQKLVLVLQFPHCPCFCEGSSPVCVSSAPPLSEQEVIGCGVTWLHHQAPPKPGIGPIPMPIPGIVHH